MAFKEKQLLIKFRLKFILFLLDDIIVPKKNYSILGILLLLSEISFIPYGKLVTQIFVLLSVPGNKEST